jgi:hypothetical protein
MGEKKGEKEKEKEKEGLLPMIQRLGMSNL